MQSRIDEVVIGSMNPKAGCAGSVLNLLEMDGFNHKVKVTRGVLEEECSRMLTDFFRELREEKKKRRDKPEKTEPSAETEEGKEEQDKKR